MLLYAAQCRTALQRCRKAPDSPAVSVSEATSFIFRNPKVLRQAMIFIDEKASGPANSWLLGCCYVFYPLSYSGRMVPCGVGGNLRLPKIAYPYILFPTSSLLFFISSLFVAGELY